MNAPAATMPRLNVGRNVSFKNSSSSANAGASFNGSTNASMPSSGLSSSMTGFLTGWGGILVIVVILVILFAVYYETIGYYIQLGWDKLGWSRKHGEKVEIQGPGGVSALMTPSPMPTISGGASIESTLANVADRLESDVEAALGSGPGKKQVFNVSRNLYTFGEAEPLCRAFGAELATYDQVKDAYEAGADWCNYGWVKGQLAVYPTQKSTYEKLQHGPEKDRMSCGVPGVNGGYFPNAEQRFGVNCYGSRPVESALDERTAHEEKSNIAFDREVTHFKSELDSIAVTPWSGKQWSE
jgi:hypothetical protein